MKRTFATALLLAGLLAAPVAALAWEGRPTSYGPAPTTVYERHWGPRFTPGYHGYPGYRHPHVVVGPRFVGPSVVFVNPPAPRVWVEPGWAWNGWQWVWVPGYWSR